MNSVVNDLYFVKQEMRNRDIMFRSELVVFQPMFDNIQLKLTTDWLVIALLKVAINNVCTTKYYERD